MGGRERPSPLWDGAVSSDQRAWKMGQAMSGSCAPSCAKRSSDMLAWTGIGRSCFCERRSFERTLKLAFAIAERWEAV